MLAKLMIRAKVWSSLYPTLSALKLDGTGFAVIGSGAADFGICGLVPGIAGCVACGNLGALAAFRAATSAENEPGADGLD